ncbi:hypothetical protein GCM10011588_17880 [Nocardia jinanensis]|uniref:2Fe-2S ferredoxin-type domain-containing protein n=1 Tax=Nocardia jinanensis TaxID=382504 RepID=A0A917RDW2_9NOCA|nr:hypothetical protein GCM10011588_17880 [Nocardia jinanensis]
MLGEAEEAVHDATTRSGLARNRVHAEAFTSLSGDTFAEVVFTGTGADTATVSATVSVGLDGVEHELRWPRAASLVDVLLSEGLNVPFSCREGECGSCVCTLRAGKVGLGNTSVLDEEDIADGYILACQARPISENLNIEF